MTHIALRFSIDLLVTAFDKHITTKPVFLGAPLCETTGHQQQVLTLAKIPSIELTVHTEKVQLWA